MRIIIQRVKQASCFIDNKLYSSINQGYLLLVSFTHDDDYQTIDKLTNKLLKLRIFEDNNNQTNLPFDIDKHEILSISQFTLYANVKNGNRPSFSDSLNAKDAKVYYNYFNKYLLDKKIKVKTGLFKEYMNINLTNDGPFTIILDSKEV